MKSRLISSKKLFGLDFSLPNAYGSTVVICMGVGLGSLLLQVIVLLGVLAVARKPPPTLVQTANGESFTVRGIGAAERDAESIKRFTGEILTKMLSWSGYLPPKTPEESTRPQLDPGIKLTADNQQYLLPTQSWSASFAIEPEFRQEFLPTLAKFVPDSVFQGKTTVFYMPSLVGEPEKVGLGQWKVDVTGMLYVIGDDNQLGELIPFNRTVYLRAITPMFERSLPVESHHPQLAQKVARIRQAALEIYALTDLEDKEIGQ